MPKTKQFKVSGEVEHYKSIKTDDALVGPSLPPFVEGQLRCFLHFSVGNLKWNGLAAFKDIQIGVKWWGQQSKPILLRPRHEVVKSTRTKHEVKYPIRSGPKQFTAYLKDMGALILDVVSNGNIIGQINITDIGLLCHSRPIKGFYSVVSSMQGTMGKEIGMLYVSLVFHSISGSMNMTSSTIPTIDMSSPSVRNEKTVKGKSDNKKALGKRPVKAEIGQKKPKAVAISAASPERIEYSLPNHEDEVPSFVVGPGQRYTDTEVGRGGDHAGYTEMKDDVMKKPGEVFRNRNASETMRHSPSMSNREVADALAELIKRGQNLRSKMMFSAIEPPQPPNELLDHSGREEGRGTLFQDILDQVDQEDSINRSIQANSANDGNVSGVEQTLVDLITGDDANRVGRILKKLERDPDASLSDEFSDVEDPTHEDSLITDLFYTANNNEESESSVVMTDDSESENKDTDLTSPHLEDAGNKRPINRKHTRKKIAADNPEEDFDMQKVDGKSGKLEDSNSMTYLNPNTTEDDSVQNHETGSSNTAAMNFVESMEKLIPEGMDLDNVTTLARVHSARVIIRTLDLKAGDLERFVDCTFFVEYDFPVNSLGNISKTTSYSELTRCASNKLQEGSILFNHRSVFPVHFDAAAIASWWDRHVTFKLYIRSRTEHTPTFVGKQSFALRKVFLNEAFAFSERLTIVKNASESNRTEDEDVFGTLQVSIELASERGDVRRKVMTAKSDIDVVPPQNRQMPMQIPTKDMEKPQSVIPTLRISHMPEKRERDIGQPQVHHAAVSQPLPKQGSLLKSVLFIGEGRGVSCSSKGDLARPANCFLVCRMFWDEEASRSQVCWNTLDPEFNFIQAIPVVLNNELLERARNNFMVVEVWDKSLSAADDKLIGVVKVSLHPFYMSFKEPSIAKTLLQSQYPVIAVDGLVKINDLFGNRDCGHLQVLLALGSQDQIENLLRIKGRKPQNASPEINQNRGTARDGYEQVSYKQNSNLRSGTQAKDTSVDHIFGISIENAKNLGASLREESTERDCFVQYQFPDQQSTGRDCSLTWHRTPTILFVDNPVFGYSQKHVITALVDAPVQHLFLSSFEDRRTSSGIAFEVWQRSYFPNIRDCVIYKAMIPVAKIYAMMAMSRTKDSSFQTFKLPLSPIDSSSIGIYSEDAKLNISISYQQRRHITSNIDLYESKSPCVCISVGILRACGLKACFLNQSKKDYAKVSIPSTINTFVKVSISVLGPESARISPAVARTFAPTFSFHVDFPVNVVQDFIEDDEHDESSTLAYHLESGFLHAQIFQKKVKSGFLSSKYDEMEDDSSEVLIGDCRIPLSGLLSKSTGIKGWFPVNRPHRKRPKEVFHHTCDADEFGDFAGGLEVALNFAKESDRELVINTARGIGWSPLESLEMHEDSFSATATADIAIVGLNAHISVSKVWIATEILEKWTDKDIRNLRLYCRYKFYDKVALVTKLVPLERTSSADVVSADLNHMKRFQIAASSALSWYLREELIEFQFWLRITGKEQSLVVSHTRDKLLGSVFASAAAISRNATLQGSISGLYPMYKFGADFIGKSSARVSIHITDDKGQAANINNHYNQSVDEDYPQPSDSEETSVTTPSTDSGNVTRVKNIKTGNLNSVDDTDAVITKPNIQESRGEQIRIIIEEALHLPVEITSLGARSPSTYVSYQLTPFHKAVCTSVAYDTTKPKWNVENMERIDPSKIPNQMISFKVFKKAPERDKRPDVDKDVLLGTASVDLSLLTTGFRQIHGWYNLVDFAGQQNGQIKVGVIPEKPLAKSPSTRYFRKETLVNKVHCDIPWTHHHVARPLVFDENYLQENKDTEDKVDIKSAVMPDQDDTRLSETSKSVLFNRLRDQIIGLDSLTKDLRCKLQGNSEKDPDGSSSLLHRFDQRDCVGSKDNSRGISVVSQNLLNEENHLSPDTVTNAGNTARHTKEDTNTEKENRFVVDSFDSRNPGIGDKQRYLAEMLADDESACNPQTTENDEIQNDKIETVETDEGLTKESISITRLSSISDSGDWKFDSFEDILKYGKKHQDENFLESVVLDESTEVFDHSQSDNETIAKDVPFPLQKSLSLDSDSEYHPNRSNDISSVECSEQVYFEKQTCPNSNAILLDEDQSYALHKLQSSTQERTDDIATNGVEALNTFDNLNDAAESKSATSVSNKKMSELPEVSTVSGGRLLQDPTALEEDSSEKTNEHCGSQDGFASNSELVEDKAVRANAPNFFMSQEMLAQSMQKLRLAVTHQLSDAQRKEDVVESDSFGIDMGGHAKSRFDRRKNYYATKNVKVSLDKPPPLESSEINRIASIFSTKFT